MNEASIRLLFIGDLVGDDGPHAGLANLERWLPSLRERYAPHAIIVNAENVAMNGRTPQQGCGLTPDAVERLFATGVDLITGGNHSWDGPHAAAVHEDARVLRPHNYGTRAPGTGIATLDVAGRRVGVMNLVGRSALPLADHPIDVFEHVRDTWGDDVDAIFVDFHAESVSEKQIFAWAVAGRAAAVVGTHTHVPTMDARILPGGTAYVTDVGMTGPDGGMQGYDPTLFVARMRDRIPSALDGAFADGPAVLGAVVVDIDQGTATAIERCDPHFGGTA